MGRRGGRGLQEPLTSKCPWGGGEGGAFRSLSPVIPMVLKEERSLLLEGEPVSISTHGKEGRGTGLYIVRCCVAVLQGLKNHAVTMFEVGKLADESMDSFIVELGKVWPYIQIYNSMYSHSTSACSVQYRK